MRKLPKSSTKHKRSRADDDEKDSGADSIAAFIASQNLDDGISVNPESLTFAPPNKKKANKKALQEEIEKIKKRKLREVPQSTKVDSEDELDDDSEGDGIVDDGSDLDPEEEAELAAYLEMMDEKSGQKEIPKKETAPEKKFYNNEQAMKRALNNIKLDVPWIETMVITTKTRTLPASDPDELKSFVRDDLKRELAFIQQALYAAEEGRKKIVSLGVKFSRPDDYYAEMVKSDEHMAKIRQRLLDEQQQIIASENAKKQREAKKFGKKVQVEKQLERIKEKKANMEKVTVAKKKKGSGAVGIDEDGGDGGDGDDMFGVEVDHDAKPERKKVKKDVKKSSKREFKDGKFGFGGRKRNLKSNTADSTNDMSGFSAKKMKIKAVHDSNKRKGPKGGIQKKQRKRK
ncbi:rRNA-processing protein and EBNA1-binding protein ebp2 [Nowakowskiella sp. JEL0407]|nr:rRNA-processing protein and EBNA1-binding protein ebp2 [Nowakowskiella sp. JEL0407]